MPFVCYHECLLFTAMNDRLQGLNDGGGTMSVEERLGLRIFPGFENAKV